MSNTEFLREVYKKYGLTTDDVTKLHGQAIILKTGIQKIQSAEQFEYRFDVLHCSADYCAVRCTVSKDGAFKAESLASAEKANVKNGGKYYLEMAEKRAKARATLIAVDVHGYLHAEDEMPANDVSKLDQVKQLYNDTVHWMNPNQVDDIKRIIERRESASYDTAIKIMQEIDNEVTQDK